MTDQELEDFVAAKLQLFYKQRLEKLQGITLTQVLKKNSYLFKAKGITDAADFVRERSCKPICLLLKKLHSAASFLNPWLWK